MYLHICHSQQESLTYVYCSFVNIKNHLVVNHYQIRNLRNGIIVKKTVYALFKILDILNYITYHQQQVQEMQYYISLSQRITNRKYLHSEMIIVRMNFSRFGTLVICNIILQLGSSCCETDFPPLTVKEKPKELVMQLQANDITVLSLQVIQKFKLLRCNRSACCNN